MDLKTLQKKVSKTKRNLKEWEATFSEKHGRPPTIQDINDRPYIVKFYKKYNELKKTLKEETDAALFQQSCSHSPPPLDTDSQTASVASQSPERFKQVESSFTKIERKLTEDEAFWLGVDSQSIPSYTETIVPKHNNSKPRLILGSLQSKKMKKLKRSYVRDPFERAVSSQEIIDDNSSVTSIPSPLPLSQPINDIIDNDDNVDDIIEDIEIVNHAINHFKNYNYQENIQFSKGPCFFSKASHFGLMLNESRQERLLYKLNKGTLGEVNEENNAMEQELDDIHKQFISTYSQPDPSSFESFITDIDEELLNSYQYKKKPLQKRQTKLFKMRFVETS